MALKNIWLFILAFTSLFARERHLVPNPYGNAIAQVDFPDEQVEEIQIKSRFFYLSGGMTFVFPTVTIGYRETYGIFASDFSLSGVYGIIPFVQYKQLLSFRGTWAKSIVPYIGPKLGVYMLGSAIFDVGAVTGVHFNGYKLSQFLELGIGSHFLGTCGRTTWGMPSLSYGLLF